MASDGNGREATAPTACIVIPCFNEADRLDRSAMLDLVADGTIRLLFVDDGSTDGTATVLAELAGTADGVEVVSLGHNVGKAEAVRQGLLAAAATGSSLIGYYDADLATPPAELRRLIATLVAHPEVQCVLGARVALLGTAIHRRMLRHYLGRLFASAASAALGVRVYDTQCGAKVFRRGPAFDAAIARPFRSRWAFDVELLDRLLTGSGDAPPVPVDALLEMPLQAWRDVPGSQMSASGAALALVGVARIGWGRAARVRRHDARVG